MRGAPRRSAKSPVPSSADPLLRRYLSAQAAALLAADSRVRAGLPDAVGQADAAVRRVHMALRIFATSVQAPAGLDDRLSALAEVFGRARDAALHRERLAQTLQALPADLLLDATMLDDSLPELIESHRALLETMNAESYFQLLDDVTSAAAGPLATRAADDAAVRALRKARRRLRRVMRRTLTTQDIDEDTLRQAQQAAVRVQVAAEVLAPRYGKKARRIADAADKLQAELGGHQVSVVLREQPRTRRTITTHQAFTIGALYGLELQRAKDSRRRFRQAWRKIEKSRHRWPG
jgi:CHAD domain-containing protein